ncbi:hypothetical protein DDZ18_05645 [Marinicauda salina]|uniref:EF-hand domain-containing protein n=1 Tax=Marinicauda salina TaxID=2135793 RepID=A0A2U2BT80_9PROT|nr:hypothetical protein [Marinicauda salina]PWE17180.1 hypothetical protein DDZ18_05645 [Marinicauda salina]
MPIGILARALAAACAGLALVTGGAAAQTLVELRTWYSPSRGDHFTTTQDSWAGSPGDRRSPDYRMIRSEGRIFSPDAPQPPGTVELWSFWHPGRGDNFLTSDPAWTSQATRDGYRRFRLEGYVFDRPVAGAAPLVSYWSGTRADNFASTDARLQVARGDIVPNDRSGTTLAANYRRYRTEGFVFPPAADQSDSESFGFNLSDVGYADWRPRAPGEGALPDDPLARERTVSTPLLISMIAFEDKDFGPTDLARYGRLFGDDPGNFSDMLNSTSNGRYQLDTSFLPIVRDDIRFDQLSGMKDGDDGAWALSRDGADGRARFRDLYGFDMSEYDLDGDGIERHEVEYRTRVLHLLDRRINFARYDANGDGLVDRSELMILRFGADDGIGGQMGFSLETTLDGVRVRIPVLLVARETTLAGLVHETMHAWGGVDIYGPRRALNYRATPMAAMLWDDRFMHFDPWHKARFGWVRPRFQPIDGGAGATLLGSPGHDVGRDWSRPIVFYDPARGLDEYFMVEFRTPHPADCAGSHLPDSACPRYADNGVSDAGLVVWHYRATDGASVRPADVRRRDDPDDRFAWPGDTAEDGHMLHLAVARAPDGRLGGRRYWRSRDGEIPLTWWDGSDAGVTLSVGPMTETSRALAVSWRSSGDVFRPRIDRVGVAGAVLGEYTRVAPGQTFHLDGVFGETYGGFTVSLFGEDGSHRSMSLDSFAPTRLIVTVPDDMPPGRYELALGNNRAIADGRRDRMSNAALIEIAGGGIVAQLDPEVARAMTERIGPIRLQAVEGLQAASPQQPSSAAAQQIELTPADIGLEGGRVPPIRDFSLDRPVDPHAYQPLGVAPQLDANQQVQQPAEEVERSLEDAVRDELRDALLNALGGDDPN